MEIPNPLFGCWRIWHWSAYRGFLLMPPGKTKMFPIVVSDRTRTARGRLRYCLYETLRLYN